MGAKLDQHFLIDPGARDVIIAAANIGAGESVVEIGPGKGVLTRELLKRGGRVTAIELDRGLAENLERELGDHPDFLVMRGDFLKLELGHLGPGPHKIVANLPYAVATPILQLILAWDSWTSAVLMFQKEVAERLGAGAGDSGYGLLALSVWLRAEVEWVAEVGRRSFSPPPRVDSAVVRLRRRSDPLVSGADEKAFFRVARAAFSQRRKMAVGVLSKALGLEREGVAAVFRGLGVSPEARAETIPPEVYLRLPELLGKAGS